jgi:toluene monooxygenase electron transfer component
MDAGMPKIALVNKPEISFDCAADDTVLRAALRAGHGFPYECNVGSCGNCLFEIAEGSVEHNRKDAPAWTERHKARNRWLGCQARPLSDLTIKVNLRDHYAPKHCPARLNARLASVEDITHDIREFRFSLSRDAPFLAGQYALLYVPGVEGARAYSMSNISDDGAGRWDFQIKKVPGGACTERLFADVQIGDEIVADGPFGMAYLREDAPRDILCLAGGSGLSPMISIARAFARSEALAGRQLHFVYGGRRVRDICGEPILRTLGGFGERIHYHPVISEAADDPDGGTWSGRIGFVHDAAQAIYGERLKDLEIYFAGPPAMATAVTQMMHAAKVPPAQIHYDQFY